MLRELLLQESGKARLQQQVGRRSTMPRRRSALMLPKKFRAGAIPILPCRVQTGRPNFRCVTALSINSELTGDGSAAGAWKRA